MSSPSLRPAVLLAILVLGVCSQIIQALLIRESLVIFYGNEVSLGVFFGGWLFWVAVGSWALPRLQRRSWVDDSRLALARILVLLPVLVAVQVAAVRAVRALFDIPSIELVPLGDLVLWEALVTLPGSLALGLAFPLACKAARSASKMASAHGPARSGSSSIRPATCSSVSSMKDSSSTADAPSAISSWISAAYSVHVDDDVAFPHDVHTTTKRNATGRLNRMGVTRHRVFGA